ncbi:MAG: hypothetical protein IT360_27280 [Gemmatimonadaceae bacterium]|nr:hypothetical protein [Gemmatimonadaceae bacterium]
MGREKRQGRVVRAAVIGLSVLCGVALAAVPRRAAADDANYQCKGISACQAGNYTCTVYCGTGRCSCTNSVPE